MLALAALAAGCGSGGGSGPADTTTAREDTVTEDLTPPETGSTRPPPERPAIPRPRIVRRPIPFPGRRKQEMAAYARRHYGIDGYELRRPRVIVQHVTVTDDFESVYNTFARDVPDPELNELPGTCSHYVVDKDGTIYQLVPLTIMCRHTVGLNHTSVGIEHVAQTDADLLGNRAQLQASLRLTRWLRCRLGVGAEDVIGHNESLSSPYHEERVARLRTQTHGDMTRASMRTYRKSLGDVTC